MTYPTGPHTSAQAQATGFPASAGMAGAATTPPSPEMLHPNLARLAVEYDLALSAFERGEISADVFRARVHKLRARDDQGVFWTIRPDGRWARQLLDGHMVVDTPPAFGIPSLTAHQLSPPNHVSTNPDQFIAKPDSMIAGYSGVSAPGRSRVSDSPTVWRRFMAWPYRRLAIAAAALGLAGMLLLANAFLSDPTPTSPSVPTVNLEVDTAPVAPGDFSATPTVVVEP